MNCVIQRLTCIYDFIRAVDKQSTKMKGYISKGDHFGLKVVASLPFLKMGGRVVRRCHVSYVTVASS